MSTTFNTDVKNAKLTFLVENKSEMLVQSRKPVNYFTQKALLAEPGLSILIQLDNKDDYILFDSGASDIVINENSNRMGIDLNAISKIVLSHGHFDHAGGMSSVLNKLNTSTNIPLIIHPASYRHRWMLWDNGKKNGPLITPIEEWSKLGADIIVSADPAEIEPGCFTTGYIPRTSFEHYPSNGIKNVYEGTNGEYIIDDISDEIGLVINIKDKGLVIISGCAHAGILNTIYAAQKVTGINKVYAVIGGFHLAFSSESYIKQVISEMKKINPTYIIPTHCTGYKAMKLFSEEMGEKFVLATVGATFTFD